MPKNSWKFKNLLFCFSLQKIDYTRSYKQRHRPGAYLCARGKL